MKSLKALLGLLIFFGMEVAAIEISVYGGTLNHSNVGGCCDSTGSLFGGGALGRFQFQNFGEIEFLAFSAGKWNEGLVLKPFYLLGRPILIDSGAGDFVRAQTISDWRIISSLGAGMFSHTARTKDFDLPTLVTGVLVSNFNQFIYAFDDRWSGLGIFQVSIAASRSDTSLLFGGYLGASYNFN